MYSSFGAALFEALFIINPNVIVEYLYFDIVGDSSVKRNFLINGTIPPLVLQTPFQSMYLLTITNGTELDTINTMDITFSLSAFIHISGGITEIPSSNVTLHIIGEYTNIEITTL